MNINLDNQVLKSVIEAISNEVHVLESVRDENNVIVDFKYLAGSNTTFEKSEDLSGKSVIAECRSNKEADLFHQFVRVVETGKSLDIILQRDKDDHHQWVHIRAKKLNDGLIIYNEDVTAARQAEEKIMQLNKALFAKNRELESISSELKTFTTIVAGDYNETLKNLYSSMEFIVSNDARHLSDAGKANIRRMQAVVQKMKLLTNDIIAFSEVHSDDRMIAVDLNDALANVLVGLVEKMKAENALVRTDKLPVIEGYPSLISLLFHHLISNAIKFRKKEVDPLIEVTHSVQRGIDIDHSASTADTTYNLISVIDNGIGYDPSEREKIFTMFYRVYEKGKQKGGVGLAICKKIMDLHNGFIVSDCTPECTIFKCYFPDQRTLPPI